MDITDEAAPDRQQPHRWRWLILVPLLPALVALGFVAVAPYTFISADDYAEPLALESDTPEPSFSAPAWEPIAAPSPSTSAQAAEFDKIVFEQPDIDIVPPPPPPPSSSSGGGKSGSSGGGCSYKGVTGSTAKDFLGKINTARGAGGVAPLTWSSSLACIAAKYSAKMAYTDTTNGGGPANALVHNPNRPKGGENVAVYATTGSMGKSAAISQMHSQYMNSAPHYANLMDPRWTKMGAGVATVQINDGSHTWTVWYSTENFQS